MSPIPVHQVAQADRAGTSGPRLLCAGKGKPFSVLGTTEDRYFLDRFWRLRPLKSKHIPDTFIRKSTPPAYATDGWKAAVRKNCAPRTEYLGHAERGPTPVVVQAFCPDALGHSFTPFG